MKAIIVQTKLHIFEDVENRRIDVKSAKEYLEKKGLFCDFSYDSIKNKFYSSSINDNKNNIIKSNLDTRYIETYENLKVTNINHKNSKMKITFDLSSVEIPVREFDKYGLVPAKINKIYNSKFAIKDFEMPELSSDTVTLICPTCIKSFQARFELSTDRREYISVEVQIYEKSIHFHNNIFSGLLKLMSPKVYEVNFGINTDIAPMMLKTITHFLNLIKENAINISYVQESEYHSDAEYSGIKINISENQYDTIETLSLVSERLDKICKILNEKITIPSFVYEDQIAELNALHDTIFLKEIKFDNLPPIVDYSEEILKYVNKEKLDVAFKYDSLEYKLFDDFIEFSNCLVILPGVCFIDKDNIYEKINNKEPLYFSNESKTATIMFEKIEKVKPSNSI